MVLLGLVTTLMLYARPELAMETTLGLDPLAMAVLDSGLSWRLYLFLVLPLFLLWVGRDCEGTCQPLVLLRAGGYRTWLMCAAATAGGKALPLLLCTLAPALVLGLGAGSPLGSAELLAEAGITALSVGVNLSILGVAVLSAGLFLGRTGALVAVSFIFAACVIGSARPSEFAPLNIGYGVQVGASIQHYGSWSLGLALPTLCNSLLVLGGIWLATSKKFLWRRLWIPVVGLLVVARFALGDWSSPAEALLGGFYGTGGTLPDYIFVALVTLAPIWVSSAHFEPALAGLQYRLVRRGSVARWLAATIGPYLLLVHGYFVAVLGLSVAVLFARFDAFPTSSADLPVPPSVVIIHLLVNGTLQGWAFVVIVASIRLMVGAPVGALMTLGLLLAGGAAASNSLPTALLNMGTGQLFEGESVWLVSAVAMSELAVISCLAMAILRIFGSRFVERNLIA
ncbi:MAG: hypothetical protein QM619_08730 [Micropruina sp.]